MVTHDTDANQYDCAFDEWTDQLQKKKAAFLKIAEAGKVTKIGAVSYNQGGRPGGEGIEE